MDSRTGYKLKLLRTKYGLTQKDLANLLNKSISQKSNYERGRRNLDKNEIEKICNYLKINREFFDNK